MGYAAMAAAAATLMLAGAAQAHPYYDQGELPPPPYGYAQVNSGGGCHTDHFTLLGAHAGVTVLGVDLGASAHLGVPVERSCGGGSEVIAPRAYAPPPPMPYSPPPYAYQGEPGYGYAPPPRPMAWGCGCAVPERW